MTQTDEGLFSPPPPGKTVHVRLISFLSSLRRQEKTQTHETFTKRYHQEFISPGAAGFARTSAAAGRRKRRRANENKH